MFFEEKKSLIELNVIKDNSKPKKEKNGKKGPKETKKQLLPKKEELKGYEPPPTGVTSLARRPLPVVTLPQPSRINAVAYSTRESFVACGGDDGVMRVWNTKTREMLSELAPPDDDNENNDNNNNNDDEVPRPSSSSCYITALTFSASGQLLYIGYSNGIIRSCLHIQGRWVKKFIHGTQPISGIAFCQNPQLSQFVSSSLDGRVIVWESGVPNVLQRTTDEGDSVVGATSVSFLQYPLKPEQVTLSYIFGASEVIELEYLIAAGYSNGTVGVWKYPNLRYKEVKGHSSNSCVSVAISYDGLYIASGADDRKVRLWHAESLELIWEAGLHTDYITCVAFSTNNSTPQQLVSGSRDGTIRLWEIDSGLPMQVFRGHQAGVTCLNFHGEGKRLLTGSTDKTIRVWRLSSGEKLARLQHPGDVNCVLINSSHNILSGGTDRQVHLWDLKNGGHKLIPFPGLTGHIQSIAQTARYIAASSAENIGIYDLVQSEPCPALHLQSSTTTCVDFSPDGKCLASGSRDGVIVWDTKGWTQLARLSVEASLPEAESSRMYLDVIETGGQDSKNANLNDITYVTFRSDGALLAGSASNLILLWATEGWRFFKRLRGHTDKVTSVAFAPNQKHLASGAKDQSVIIWDIQAGVSIQKLMHNGVVTTLTYLPDGRLATGTHDGLVSLWRPETGELLREFKGHNRKISGVSASNDGMMLASSSWDGVVQVWSVDTPPSFTEIVTDDCYVNVKNIKLLVNLFPWLGYVYRRHRNKLRYLLHHFAEDVNSLEILQLLLQWEGANPLAVIKEDDPTPLDLALIHSNLPAIEVLSKAIVKQSPLLTRHRFTRPIPNWASYKRYQLQLRHLRPHLHRHLKPLPMIKTDDKPDEDEDEDEDNNNNEKNNFNNNGPPMDLSPKRLLSDNELYISSEIELEANQINKIKETKEKTKSRWQKWVEKFYSEQIDDRDVSPFTLMAKDYPMLLKDLLEEMPSVPSAFPFAALAESTKRWEFENEDDKMLTGAELPFGEMDLWKRCQEDPGEGVMGPNMVNMMQSRMSRLMGSTDEDVMDGSKGVEVTSFVAPFPNLTRFYHKRRLNPLWAVCQHKELLGTKVIQEVIEFKWRQFGQVMLMRRFLGYLFFLAVFVLTTFLNPNSYSYSKNLLLVLHAILLLFGLYFGYVEMAQLWRERTAYLWSLWNWLDLALCVLILVEAPWAAKLISENAERSDRLRIIQAATALISWLRILEFLRAFRYVGPFVRMVSEITRSILPFITILLIVLIGFSHTFALLYWDSGSTDEDIFTSRTVLLAMYRLMLNPDVNYESFSSLNNLLRDFLATLAVFFTFFVNVILFNLLIAQMGEVYNSIQGHVEIEWLLERVRVLLELEIFSNFQSNDLRYFPTWLHVLQPKHKLSTRSIENEELYRAIQQQQQTNDQSQDDLRRQLSTVTSQLSHMTEQMNNIHRQLSQQSVQFRKYQQGHQDHHHESSAKVLMLKDKDDQQRKQLEQLDELLRK